MMRHARRTTDITETIFLVAAVMGMMVFLGFIAIIVLTR